VVKKLFRTGNRLALVLDKPLLDRLDIDADTPLEISTDDEVIVISKVRDKKRTTRFQAIVRELDRDFSRVFKRLA